MLMSIQQPFLLKSARSSADKLRIFSTKVTKKLKTKNGTNQEQLLKRFDWENNALYGPLLKNSPPSTENKETEDKVVTNENKSIVSSHRLPQITILPSFPLSLITKDKNLEENELQLKAARIFQGIRNENIKFPSVSAILQKTISPESAAVLERWRNEMISKLGIEGFLKYQKETFQTGESFHKMIHDFLSGIPERDVVQDQIKGYWQSISSVLPHISNVISLEKRIIHPYLKYVGVLDCVASYKGTPTIIEWKTSQKPKPTLKYTYDNPVQLAAYLGGWNFTQNELDSQIERGIIVVAYPNGDRAHVHPMADNICVNAWNSWLIRLNQFWQLQKFQSAESSL